jgi:acetyl esterase/lipase
MHATDEPHPLVVRLLVGSLVALLLGACSGGGQASSAAPASAEPLESPKTGSASSVASPSTAGLPIHHVYDLAYARSVLPATTVGVDPGTEVLLDVYAPDAAGPWPIVIWAPGGEETKVMGQPFGEAMASSGAVVFVINTVHSLDPTVPPLGLASRALVEGAACAVRTARALAPAYGGDPGRVVWSGHSLGGVYGFELALAVPDWERMWTEQVGGPGPTLDCLTDTGLSAIDAIVTASSGRFIEVWPTVYDADPSVRAFTDSVSHVGNNPSLKVRLVHGDSDPELPLATAQGLERELTAAGYDVKLDIVPLASHGLFFPQLVERILGVVRS